MKKRLLIEAGGPSILNPGEGPGGAGFMPLEIPLHPQPKTLFGIPAARIPAHLIEPMLKPGACVYADVDFDSPDDDPNLATVFGFYLDDSAPWVSISNLELEGTS